MIESFALDRLTTAFRNLTFSSETLKANHRPEVVINTLHSNQLVALPIQSFELPRIRG